MTTSQRTIPAPLRRAMEAVVSGDRPLAQGGSDIQRAQKLARLMDDAYLDPLIGLLLPGAGDLVTLAPSLYVVLVALRNGVSKAVIARMLLNLALDLAVGSIPVLGDLFDAGFKANKRNVELLQQRHEQGGQSRPTDWLWLIGSVALFLGALSLPLMWVIAILTTIFSQV